MNPKMHQLKQEQKLMFLRLQEDTPDIPNKEQFHDYLLDLLFWILFKAIRYLWVRPDYLLDTWLQNGEALFPP